MQQLNEAIDALEDPELRKMFEREIEENCKAEQAQNVDHHALQKHYRDIQKIHQIK